MSHEDIDRDAFNRGHAMSTLAESAAARPLYQDEAEFPRFEAASDELGQRFVFGFRGGDQRARPFKLLRTRIAQLAADDNVRLIGVTSAAPNVGKTFVAVNLAAALSRLTDTHVCAIDLDLHRPALGPRIGLPEGNGVHDYLGGDVGDIREIGYRVNDERLVVIPGYRRNVATGELLSGPRGEAMFAGLRAMSKTLVIVDMPPIFADDDAVIIANRIDGYLLVVEDGRTTKKQVADTIRMLSPAPMLGTVLNRYKRRLFSDDYGYGVSYGYGAYY
ncbi:CpsD/CapB family tyrosine-protein kinase [Sphingomonas sp. BIUV-7]|uniref:CpsD/CapB family tyrosine-protein kinase n=1 Tax=Sphingomonas natans TaxID=3063330 RepID=A0ABT8YFV0_9SPHN|nr:CpsD/CapB family tyrosine-protein kinase [Sphingomonas sp. BIUV-7]MDO6416803.1 CpsD/CapB family tyrosine-protein kinase [Sphingomonas sp. BIUV-7]